MNDQMSRRHVLSVLAAGSASLCTPWKAGAQAVSVTGQQLDAAANAPLLHLEGITKPVIIDSIELLRNGREFLVRIRSRDGAEAVTIPNSSRLRDIYPIFLNRVAPFWKGRDARNIQADLFELYRYQSNYKFQGLAFWVSVAALEMAILDLLGQISGKSIGELFGGVVRRDVAVYRASGNRGNTPEEEIEHLQGLVAETGAKALKFRVGGRMSKNADSLPGRSEALIPLVRETFGDEMTIYADSNSSYDVRNAIRIGKLMEEHRYGFFEEPCPFDHLWETRRVTQALEIPVAGGEQEFSLRRFKWAIQNRAVDIVQPDLHYYGGYIRCTQVARMAAAAGMQCTVHMSGAGLGYLNTLHFASYVKNSGAHQEFKGESRIPFECPTSDLRCRNGVIRVPSGPGFGVTIAPAFVQQAVPVTTM